MNTDECCFCFFKCSAAGGCGLSEGPNGRHVPEEDKPLRGEGHHSDRRRCAQHVPTDQVRRQHAHQGHDALRSVRATVGELIMDRGND